jgi:hypothetical protein
MQDFSCEALTQENMRLAQENMLLRAMQEHTRLARENLMLRMQAQVLPPPGLEALVPEIPMPKFQSSSHLSPAKHSKAPRLKNQPVGTSKSGALHSETFEESTVAGSSLPCSLETSREPSEADHECLGDFTSVMMRNLPNSYTRETLLELLETEGYAGTFDFLYLPIDFKSKSSLGYAFINFASHDAAERFREHFAGFNRWSKNGSDKVCEVAYSELQGLEAHIQRYRNSPVMHKSVPEDQKPLLFAGLERVSIPAPTKELRAPRQWRRRH